MQKPLAKCVNRLDLQAARRLDRAREETAREGEVLTARDVVGDTSPIAAESSASSRRVHRDKVLKIRIDILAAAAFVKVRQRILAGGTSASRRRMTSAPAHAFCRSPHWPRPMPNA